MLYREIMAVCSQIHTKRINKLCGQNVESLVLSHVALNIHASTPPPPRVRQSHIFFLVFFLILSPLSWWLRKGRAI